MRAATPAARIVIAAAFAMPMIMPVVASAAPATVAQPSQQAPASAENTATTGKTKPPGAALPAGHSKLDDLERKAHNVGEKSQQSICKC